MESNWKLLYFLFLFIGDAKGYSDVKIGPFTRIDQKCLTTEKTIPSIIGGINVLDDSYPFLHFCSGTMISNRVVLTAAQCIWLQEEFDFREELNSTKGVLQESVFAAIEPYCRHQEGKGRFKVEQYYITSAYNGKPEDGNDICILILEEGLNYPGPYMNFDFEENYEKIETDILSVIGWAATSAAEIFPSIFRSTVTPIFYSILQFLEDTECSALLQGEDNTGLDDLSVFCAQSNASEVCYGDIGSPLYINNNSTLIQLGIMSLGADESCIIDGFVGAFTQINNYADWINQTFMDAMQVLLRSSIDTQTPQIQLESPVQEGGQSPLVPQPQNDFCLLPVDIGNGEAYITSYYFDNTTNNCVEFGWTGRGGNDNNFALKKECMEDCQT